MEKLARDGARSSSFSGSPGKSPCSFRGFSMLDGSSAAGRGTQCGLMWQSRCPTANDNYDCIYTYLSYRYEEWIISYISDSRKSWFELFRQHLLQMFLSLDVFSGTFRIVQEIKKR